MVYVALVLMACVASQVSLMALCRLCVCVHSVCRFPSYFSRRVIFQQISFLGVSRFKSVFMACAGLPVGFLVIFSFFHVAPCRRSPSNAGLTLRM